MGIRVRSNLRNRLEANRRNESFLWSSPDIGSQRSHFAKFLSNGRLTERCVRDFRKHCHRRWRLFRVAARCLFKSARRTGHAMGIVQQGGENNRSPNAVWYEEFGSCADPNDMGFACKKAWDLHKNMFKGKGAQIQACEKLFRPPSRNTQERSCRISFRLPQ